MIVSWHAATAICRRDRHGNICLVPADFVAEELFQKIEEGREVLIQIRKARSPKQHRLFFALVNVAVENLTGWTVETLVDSLKVTLGHFTIGMNLSTGEIFQSPKSISFASMDQISFQTFFNASLDELAAFLGCTPDELLNEVASREQDLRPEELRYRRRDIPAHTPIGHNWK